MPWHDRTDKNGRRDAGNPTAYEVPAQSLSVDLARIPALPKSGFLIRQVLEASAR